MIKNAAIRSAPNRGLLVLSLVLAAVSAVLIGVFLSRADKGGGGGFSGPTVPVVVAAKDIPALARISEGMVVVKEIPSNIVLPGAFTATDGVIGQVTQVPIVAGEQVIPSKVTATDRALATFGDNAPLSFTIPEGKRAFSVSVFEVSAAGGLVRAGDFVDVILSGSRPAPVEGQPQPDQSLIPASACYVVQDVEVLAVAQNLKPVGTDEDATGIASSQTDAEALSATLAVTPDQAWRLAAAQEGVGQGNVDSPLWVSLRPFGERGDVGGIPFCNLTPGS